MDKRKEDGLAGEPSDYGSRTLADRQGQRSEFGDIGRTADGEPRVERGTADSAISHDRDEGKNDGA